MKEVVLRFGIPKVLVFDNGTQFELKKFKEHLAELNIQQKTSSVYQPRASWGYK